MIGEKPVVKVGPLMAYRKHPQQVWWGENVTLVTMGRYRRCWLLRSGRLEVRWWRRGRT